MEYVSIFKNPSIPQMTLDDLWFGDDKDFELSYDPEDYASGTVTYKYQHKVSERMARTTNIMKLVRALREFNARHKSLFEVDRRTLFSAFYLEKKGKGMKMVFDSVFKSQNKYIKCDSHTVCSGIAATLQPLLKEHREIEHEETYASTKSAVLKLLEENGFDVRRVDFDSIISNCFRKISAPVPELKLALTELKEMFEGLFCQNTGVERSIEERRLYHTSAFAYVKRRGVVDTIKRHQANKSRWFAKLDLSNFFGSTTLSYTMKMFGMVFPFSGVCIWNKEELQKALSLAFLDGVLPQGTPISPLITNVIMIPVDFELSKKFRSLNDQRFIYTRYADDFIISSRYNFDVKEVERTVVETLQSFGAPFSIKEEKTRYGSSSGRNWNLGLMLNKENKITVGHEKKRLFKAQLTSYVLDRKNNKPWTLNEIQVMEGIRSYYHMVEPDAIDAIVQKIGEKFEIDVLKAIKEDLRALA